MVRTFQRNFRFTPDPLCSVRRGNAYRLSKFPSGDADTAVHAAPSPCSAIAVFRLAILNHHEYPLLRGGSVPDGICKLVALALATEWVCNRHNVGACPWPLISFRFETDDMTISGLLCNAAIVSNASHATDDRCRRNAIGQ